VYGAVRRPTLCSRSSTRTESCTTSWSANEVQGCVSVRSACITGTFLALYAFPTPRAAFPCSRVKAQAVLDEGGTLLAAQVVAGLPERLLRVRLSKQTQYGAFVHIGTCACKRLLRGLARSPVYLPTSIPSLLRAIIICCAYRRHARRRLC